MIKSPVAELHWSKMPSAKDLNVTRLEQSTYLDAFIFNFDAPKMQVYSLYPSLRHICPEKAGIVPLPSGTLYCPHCGKGLR